MIDETKEREALLPCPWCGNSEHGHTSNGWQNHCVICLQCGAEGPSAMSEAEAADSWNARSQAPAPALPVEAIESGIRSLQSHIEQICDLNDVDTADQLTGGIREGVAIIEGYIDSLRALLPKQEDKP